MEHDEQANYLNQPWSGLMQIQKFNKLYNGEKRIFCQYMLRHTTGINKEWKQIESEREREREQTKIIHT